MRAESTGGAGTTEAARQPRPGSRSVGSSHHPDQTVVELRHVMRQYGQGGAAGAGVTALDDLSLRIARGAFTAVMGASGSGKSTLMNVAAGLDDVTAGEVLLAGHPLHMLDARARTRLRREHVGFIFQAFNLVPALTVEENIRLPFALAGRGTSAETEAWIGHLVTVLGLADRRTHRPAELSGGQQQRVAIARALAPRPAVVFADEPTGNLDARASREVLALLRTAAAEYGQTIVMVSHDPVAASYADRVVVLADGRVVSDSPARSAQQIASLLVEVETGEAGGTGAQR